MAQDQAATFQKEAEAKQAATKARRAEEQQRRIAEEKQNFLRRLSGAWRTINCDQYSDFPYQVSVNGNEIGITGLHDLRGDVDIFDGTVFKGTINGLTIDGTSAYDWRSVAYRPAALQERKPIHAANAWHHQPGRKDNSSGIRLCGCPGHRCECNVLNWAEMVVKRDIARTGD